MKRKLVNSLVLSLACLLLMGVLAQSAFALPDWWWNKVQESGGNGPAPNPSPDPNYTANGTDCYTTAYSSMVGAQGKVNSCYCYRATADVKNVLCGIRLAMDGHREWCSNPFFCYAQQ
jgi:hypothetical protein